MTMTQTQLLESLENAGFTLLGNPVLQASFGDGAWTEKWQWAYKIYDNNMQQQWIKFVASPDSTAAYFLGGYDPTSVSDSTAIHIWLNNKIDSDDIEGYTIQNLDPENDVAIATIYETSGGKVKETRYFINRDAGNDLQMREIEV